MKTHMSNRLYFAIFVIVIYLLYEWENLGYLLIIWSSYFKTMDYQTDLKIRILKSYTQNSPSVKSCLIFI